MKFQISNRVISNDDEQIISYALDYLAEFELDDEWNDKIVTARFSDVTGKYIDVILEDNKCNIPLFPEGYIFVGCYTDTFTSTFVKLKVDSSIKDIGHELVVPPTADVYQQIISLIEAGKIKGDKGDDGYTPIKGIDYFDGKNGKDGSDYIITAADYQAIADRVPQPDLSDYVKNTDYATSSKGGTVKSGYGLIVETNGVTSCSYARSPQQYDNYSNYNFISKGTLENVLNERLKEPQFELIEEITLTEDVAQIERSAEPNGTPYNFKKVIVYTENNNGIDSIQNTKMYINGLVNYGIYARVKNRADRTFSRTELFVENGMFDANSRYSTTINVGSGGAANEYRIGRGYEFITDSINKLTFQQDSTVPIPSGTTIKIYGIRA